MAMLCSCHCNGWAGYSPHNLWKSSKYRRWRQLHDDSLHLLVAREPVLMAMAIHLISRQTELELVMTMAMTIAVERIIAKPSSSTI